MFIRALSFIAVLLAPLVSGYASKVSCSTPLTVGTEFMDRDAVADNSKPVQVMRNGVALASGSAYKYGEILTVSLASAPSEYILEAQGVAIPGGSCSGKRLCYKSFNATMPASGSTTIKFRGAWTTSKSTPVSITSDFVLVPSTA